ncbi:DUF3429 domain-containing protein [Porticoccaceae bacterium]|nr:DUF3429 domain-containing protein [Porticoccaceae bacterium]MDG2116852.1 DUF3429 domain-containing protein [Porticoccaceae bacterium]
MRRRLFRLINVLGYLGLMPFLGCLAIMLYSVIFRQGLHSASIFGFYGPYVFIAYSGVILSFLTGTLWSQARLSQHVSLAKNAIIFSNLLALMVWICLLIIYISPILTITAVCLLMAGFLALLYCEYFLAVEEDANYRSMRVRLTAVVCMTHVAVITLMLMEL